MDTTEARRIVDTLFAGKLPMIKDREELARAMTAFSNTEVSLLRAENLTLRGLLADVMACWRSRPLMDGSDNGHFDQGQLRALHPHLKAVTRE